MIAEGKTLGSDSMFELIRLHITVNAYKNLLDLNDWSDEEFIHFVRTETDTHIQEPEESPITVEVDYAEENDDGFESAINFLRDGEILFTIKDFVSSYSKTDMRQKLEFVDYNLDVYSEFSQMLRHNETDRFFAFQNKDASNHEISLTVENGYESIEFAMDDEVFRVDNSVFADDPFKLH